MEYKPQNEDKAKKEYRTPHLAIHGDVRVLTQAGSGAFTESTNGQPFGTPNPNKA